jgi:hypothetical protein
MSWSLEIRNGDLALRGIQFGKVTDNQKLVQDLRAALLEPQGTDDAHLNYGSVIDGGRRPDGTEVHSLLGSVNWERVAMELESEIRRIGNDYQKNQLIRAQSDRLTYGSSTLSNHEILYSITNIDMIQAQDALLCNITLQTGSGEEKTILLPISAMPITT